MGQIGRSEQSTAKFFLDGVVAGKNNAALYDAIRRFFVPGFDGWFFRRFIHSGSDYLFIVVYCAVSIVDSVSGSVTDARSNRLRTGINGSF